MSELVLRPYQKDAINQIQNLMRAGYRKILLHLAGGGGKTVIFCEVLRMALAKNNPSLIVVRGVKLIEQASLRLSREGVPHGVMQGTNSHSAHCLSQVCSIDTLYRRKVAPPARLLIIDEAHLSQGQGYEWLLQQYPDAYILAVTATPYLKHGLRHVAETVVYPISIENLMAQGYLVRPRYFAPETPDIEDIKIVSGDFHAGELDRRMQGHAIQGDIVKSWRQLANERPSLMFAVSVKHSHLLTKRFTDAGIAASHIDANSSQAERNQVIQELIEGKIKVISSVGVLTTGFDCPPVKCLIVCRPTMSKNLHIQMLYRGTRPYEGKDDFIVLDHSGNLDRHGFIEDELPADLDGIPKREKSQVPQVKNCRECLAVHYLTEPLCPACGAVNTSAQKERERKILEVEAELAEKKRLEVDDQIADWVKIAKSKKLKKGWIYYMIKGRYGDKVAKEKWNKIKVIPRWETKEREP